MAELLRVPIIAGHVVVTERSVVIEHPMRTETIPRTSVAAVDALTTLPRFVRGGRKIVTIRTNDGKQYQLRGVRSSDADALLRLLR